MKRGTDLVPREERRPPYRQAIAVDLHGVICSYTSGRDGLTDQDISPDPPGVGAIEWLIAASRVFTVYVLSGHFARPETRAPIMRSAKEWLMRHGVPRERISIEPDLCGPIVIAATKPRCILTIDDRSFCYRGEFPDLQWIRSFEPFRHEKARENHG